MKKFPFVVLAFFGIFLIIYTCVYFALVHKDKITDFAYFVLTKTKDKPRILIDSGSNSFHAIDASLIEKNLNILTLNFADDGGILLRNKLAVFEKYATKNDIIILPLEYTYYVYDMDLSYEVDKLFNRFSFQFENMNFLDQISSILNTNLLYFIKGYIKYNFYYDFDLSFIHRFNTGFRGDKEFKKHFMIDKPKTCDEYIFKNVKDLKITNNFKKNLAYMKQISQKTGAKIIITFPAVSSQNCYLGYLKDKFDIFYQELKDLLKSHKIDLISTPQKSRFDEKYFDDSYYHINNEAKQIRTLNLIDDLKEKYSDKLALMKYDESPNLEYFQKVYKLKTIDFSKTFHLGKKPNDFIALERGFSHLEQYGVWQNDLESVFVMQFPELHEDIFMHFDLSKQNGDNDCMGDVFIDNVFVSRNDFCEAVKLKLPHELISNSQIKLKIVFNSIISPIDLGVNGDYRNLKIFYKSISFSKK